MSEIQDYKDPIPRMRAIAEDLERAGPTAYTRRQGRRLSDLINQLEEELEEEPPCTSSAPSSCS